MFVVLVFAVELNLFTIDFCAGLRVLFFGELCFCLLCGDCC